jgi:hypothetical protein
MEDEHVPAVEPIRSPWRERLLTALAQVRHELLMVGPYIKDDVITLVKEVLQARADHQPLSVRVITRTLPDDFLSGASDIAALQHLLAWSEELLGSHVEVRAINNVHAKVWVFDSDLAFVGSGNATFSGLDANLEYGIAVSEPSVIARILQDWQEWWEQAAPLNAEMLDELHRWLDALTNDAEVCAAEKLVQEKRQTIESRIGQVPRIGKRLDISKNEQKVILTTTNKKKAVQSTQISQATSSLLATPQSLWGNPLSTTELLGSITVSAYEFWQALFWVFPHVDETKDFWESQKVNHPDTFLQLACVNIPGRQPVLQCIWADGKRRSLSKILGQNKNAHLSWTITLNLETTLLLMSKKETHHWQEEPGDFLLLKRDTLGILNRLEVYHGIERDGAVKVSSMSSTSTAVVTSKLNPLISSLRLLHGQLIIALDQMEQEWYELQEILHYRRIPYVPDQWRNPFHKENYPLRSIQISLDSPGEESIIVLSAGHLDMPIELNLPAYDCILGGPPIRISLDYAALWQILIGAQGKVSSWQLFIGRDVDAVQFEPQFEEEMYWANTLTWRHELRDVTA